MKFPLVFLLLAAMSPMCCSGQFLAPAPSGAPPTGSAQDQVQLDSLLHAFRPQLLFAPDDIVSVQVYGVKDYFVQQQVASDGTIAFPLVGSLPVSGLTVQQLEASLSASLAKSGMIQNPQVTVTAVSRPSAIVTVAGNVAKPGTFPAFGNKTLLDYLSEAGGLNNSITSSSLINSPASSTVILIRPSLAQPVTITLGPDAAKSPYANIPLFPGDQIRVGAVGVIYAIGAFKTQGAYPLKNTAPTTVLQLLALAGGIGYEADSKDAHIIRTTGDRRYIVDLNVAKILQGKAADVALKSDDILFVPTNQMKAALKGGAAGIAVALASAYIYTHP